MTLKPTCSRAYFCPAQSFMAEAWSDTTVPTALMSLGNFFL